MNLPGPQYPISCFPEEDEGDEDEDGRGGARGRAKRSSSHINVTADSFKSIFLK